MHSKQTSLKYDFRRKITLSLIQTLSDTFWSRRLLKIILTTREIALDEQFLLLPQFYSIIFSFIEFSFSYQDAFSSLLLLIFAVCGKGLSAFNLIQITHDCNRNKMLKFSLKKYVYQYLIFRLCQSQVVSTMNLIKRKV